eukprot:g6259.t1
MAPALESKGGWPKGKDFDYGLSSAYAWGGMGKTKETDTAIGQIEKTNAGNNNKPPGAGGAPGPAQHGKDHGDTSELRQAVRWLRRGIQDVTKMSLTNHLARQSLAEGLNLVELHLYSTSSCCLPCEGAVQGEGASSTTSGGAEPNANINKDTASDQREDPRVGDALFGMLMHDAAGFFSSASATGSASHSSSTANNLNSRNNIVTTPLGIAMVGRIARTLAEFCLASEHLCQGVVPKTAAAADGAPAAGADCCNNKGENTNSCGFVRYPPSVRTLSSCLRCCHMARNWTQRQRTSVGAVVSMVPGQVGGPLPGQAANGCSANTSLCELVNFPLLESLWGRVYQFLCVSINGCCLDIRKHHLALSEQAVDGPTSATGGKTSKLMPTTISQRAESLRDVATIAITLVNEGRREPDVGAAASADALLRSGEQKEHGAEHGSEQQLVHEQDIHAEQAAGESSCSETASRASSGLNNKKSSSTRGSGAGNHADKRPPNNSATPSSSQAQTLKNPNANATRCLFATSSQQQAIAAWSALSNIVAIVPLVLRMAKRQREPKAADLVHNSNKGPSNAKGAGTTKDISQLLYSVARFADYTKQLPPAAVEACVCVFQEEFASSSSAGDHDDPQLALFKNKSMPGGGRGGQPGPHNKQPPPATCMEAMSREDCTMVCNSILLLLDLQMHEVVTAENAELETLRELLVSVAQRLVFSVAGRSDFRPQDRRLFQRLSSEIQTKLTPAHLTFSRKNRQASVAGTDGAGTPEKLNEMNIGGNRTAGAGAAAFATGGGIDFTAVPGLLSNIAAAAGTGFIGGSEHFMSQLAGAGMCINMQQRPTNFNSIDLHSAGSYPQYSNLHPFDQHYGGGGGGPQQLHNSQQQLHYGAAAGAAPTGTEHQLFHSGFGGGAGNGVVSPSEQLQNVLSLQHQQVYPTPTTQQLVGHHQQHPQIPYSGASASSADDGIPLLPPIPPFAPEVAAGPEANPMRQQEQQQLFDNIRNQVLVLGEREGAATNNSSRRQYRITNNPGARDSDVILLNVTPTGKNRRVVACTDFSCCDQGHPVSILTGGGRLCNNERLSPKDKIYLNDDACQHRVLRDGRVVGAASNTATSSHVVEQVDDQESTSSYVIGELGQDGLNLRPRSQSQTRGRKLAKQHCIRVKNTFVHVDCTATATEDCDICALQRQRATSCVLDELNVARLMEGFHWCENEGPDGTHEGTDDECTGFHRRDRGLPSSSETESAGDRNMAEKNIPGSRTTADVEDDSA